VTPVSQAASLATSPAKILATVCQFHHQPYIGCGTPIAVQGLFGRTHVLNRPARRVGESLRALPADRGTKRIGGVRRALAGQQPARCNRVARTVNSRAGDLVEAAIVRTWTALL